MGAFPRALAFAHGSFGLIFLAAPVQALPLIPTTRVTVGSTQYDVTYFTGSYDNNSSKFETPSSNGEMPWWGDMNLAMSFASAVAGSLGLPNSTFSANDAGPFFAYFYEVSTTSWAFNGSSVASYVSLGSFANSFATASPVLPPPSTVPGPLPLLGAAAAFGMSRRLRRRIQLGD